MNRQNFSTAENFSLLLLGTILSLILNLPPISCLPNKPYTSCGVLFNCGKFTGIGFPFWGGGRPAECGYSGLKLGCENGTTTTIQINGVKYRVLDLNLKSQLLKIARDDLSQNLCPQQLTNTTLDSRLFEYASAYVNLTLLYGCTAANFPVPFQFDCAVKGIQGTIGYAVFESPLLGLCRSSIVVPVQDTSFLDFKGLGEMIGEGFEVRFKVESGGCGQCESSGGRCGFVRKSFVCFCSDHSAAESRTCDQGVGNDSQRAPAVAGVGNPHPRASTVALPVSVS